MLFRYTRLKFEFQIELRRSTVELLTLQCTTSLVTNRVRHCTPSWSKTTSHYAWCTWVLCYFSLSDRHHQKKRHSFVPVHKLSSVLCVLDEWIMTFFSGKQWRPCHVKNVLQHFNPVHTGCISAAFFRHPSHGFLTVQTDTSFNPVHFQHPNTSQCLVVIP